MHKFISSLFICALLISMQSAVAQPKAVQKGMAKAEKSKSQGKYGEAEEIYKNLLRSYPYESKVWDELAGVESTLYEYYKSKNTSSLQVSVQVSKNADEETILNAQSLQEMLNQVMVNVTYKSKLEDVCRMGSCLTPYADYLNIYTRYYFVDFNPDSAVIESAKKEYNKAESEFRNKNYNAAAKYYLKAIELDSTYYKARLYLADVYYAQQNYGEAIKRFTEAKNRFPELLEPKKYLIDALMESNTYEAAYTETIDALKCYPESGIQYRLLQICDALGYPTQLPWQRRDVLPVGAKSSNFIIAPPANTPWLAYEESYEKVKEFADKNGFLSTNSVTEHKYLELYAWEQMLAKFPDSDVLSYARDMQKEGFLDCFIFINCFHIDLMPQFKDFVANNSKKIDLYFEFLKNR